MTSRWVTGKRVKSQGRSEREYFLVAVEYYETSKDLWRLKAVERKGASRILFAFQNLYWKEVLL